jgi:hypothetical protein
MGAIAIEDLQPQFFLFQGLLDPVEALGRRPSQEAARRRVDRSACEVSLRCVADIEEDFWADRRHFYKVVHAQNL